VEWSRQEEDAFITVFLSIECKVERGKAVPRNVCGWQEIMFSVWEWPLGTLSLSGYPI